MTSKEKIRETVKEHRARMRAAGYRPVQIWVPDTRNNDYQLRLSHQLKALKNSPDERLAVSEVEAYWNEVDGWES